MAQSAPPPRTESEQFNLPRFLLTVSITLAALGAALRLLAPGVWADQFLAPAWKGCAAFLTLSLVNCFLEYIFHRYVLHQPAILGLRRFYRQHTRHHALTRIGQKPGRGGRGIVFIENKFPIVAPEQREALFFPWYSMAIFAGILTPLLAIAAMAAALVSLVLRRLLRARRFAHAVRNPPRDRGARSPAPPRAGPIGRSIGLGDRRDSGDLRLPA